MAISMYALLPGDIKALLRYWPSVWEEVRASPSRTRLPVIWAPWFDPSSHFLYSIATLVDLFTFGPHSDGVGYSCVPKVNVVPVWLWFSGGGLWWCWWEQGFQHCSPKDCGEPGFRIRRHGEAAVRASRWLSYSPPWCMAGSSAAAVVTPPSLKPPM